MLLSVALELFIAGLFIGFSRCALFCAPILLPYIAGTTKSLKQGFQTTLAFCFSRFFAYTLLGGLAGIIGGAVKEFFAAYSPFIFLFGGSFLIFLGLAIVIWKVEPRAHFCKILHQRFVSQGLLSMAIMGFITGMMPCGAFLGILSYIALIVENPWQGFFLGMSFGAGTALITPLIVLGIFASVVPAFLFKTAKIYELFRRFCGIVLIIFGFRLVFGL